MKVIFEKIVISPFVGKFDLIKFKLVILMVQFRVLICFLLIENSAHNQRLKLLIHRIQRYVKYFLQYTRKSCRKSNLLYIENVNQYTFFILQQYPENLKKVYSDFQFLKVNLSDHKNHFLIILVKTSIITQSRYQFPAGC